MKKREAEAVAIIRRVLTKYIEHRDISKADIAQAINADYELDKIMNEGQNEEVNDASNS